MGAVRRLVTDGLADVTIKNQNGAKAAELAARMRTKTIVKFFQSHEKQVRYEKDMQQLASDQKTLKERNFEVEKDVEFIKRELQSMRGEMQRISGADDVSNRRRSSDVFDQAASFSNLTSISNAQTPAAPPVPPRKRVGSVTSSLAQPNSAQKLPSPLNPSASAGPDTFFPQLINSSRSYRDKIEWWNRAPTDISNNTHLRASRGVTTAQEVIKNLYFSHWWL